MQLSSIIQSLLAVAVMAPSVLATPVAVSESSSLEERGNIMKRSYVGTCEECTLGHNGFLKCQCKKKDGKKVSSTLYLNDCFVNVDGFVYWRRGGSFLSNYSCIVWDYSHPIMWTTCNTNTKGMSRDTKINLDEKIHNIDGQLQCHV
ncbi:Cyanovirin-N [Rhypophila decipiens]|uniref:Cyanovirin-N n=1 Tax=Rhypophila decipiens TaxID=261697 RepID=A0AAN6XYF5_9PEZI|nr:Cyanovirin-N [Rhypophila decipiens]